MRVNWVSDEDYLATFEKREKSSFLIRWIYDRKFNRDVDCTKILSVTGLKQTDFATVQEGICEELKILNWKKEK